MVFVFEFQVSFDRTLFFYLLQETFSTFCASRTYLLNFNDSARRISHNFNYKKQRAKVVSQKSLYLLTLQARDLKMQRNFPTSNLLSFILLPIEGRKLIHSFKPYSYKILKTIQQGTEHVHEHVGSLLSDYQLRSLEISL